MIPVSQDRTRRHTHIINDQPNLTFEEQGGKKNFGGPFYHSDKYGHLFTFLL